MKADKRDQTIDWKQPNGVHRCLIVNMHDVPWTLMTSIKHDVLQSFGTHTALLLTTSGKLT